MYELRAIITTYLLGAVRFKWLGLLAWWLVALGGWTLVYSLPDQYGASARVFVDTDTALRPLLRGLAVETDVMSQVNLMTRALLSRPQLEKVARQTDLSLRVRSAGEMEALIKSMKSRLDISSGRGTNLYTISFVDEDRRVAQDVVKTLLDLLVEDTLGGSREDSSNAKRFLSTQIEEYEKRLAVAERDLAEFQKANVGMMPGQDRDHYARLETALAEVDEVKANLAIALRQQAELQRQFNGEEPTFFLSTQAAPRSTASPLDESIKQYERRLDDLLLNFTEAHPDVVALKETIATLKQRREAEAKPAVTGSAPSNVQTNPVYQNIKISLNQADLEVATLRERLKRKEAQVEELNRIVNNLPEVEAQMKRLNRDYQITKSQYEALLQRREVARLSEDADLSNDDVKFRVIEPPKATLQPIGPNRPLLLSGALVGGLGVGVALSFFLGQVRPVFPTTYSLRQALPYPVLGSISAVRSASRVRIDRLKSLWFVACAGALVAAFGAAMLLRDAGLKLPGLAGLVPL